LTRLKTFDINKAYAKVYMYTMELKLMAETDSTHSAI